DRRRARLAPVARGRPAGALPPPSPPGLVLDGHLARSGAPDPRPRVERAARRDGAAVLRRFRLPRRVRRRRGAGAPRSPAGARAVLVPRAAGAAHPEVGSVGRALPRVLVLLPHDRAREPDVLSRAILRDRAESRGAVVARARGVRGVVPVAARAGPVD